MQEILGAIKNAEANDGKEMIEAVSNNTFIEPPKMDPLFLNSVAQSETIPAPIATIANRMYEVCNLDIVLSNSSEDFLHFNNAQKIKSQITQVLEMEAPITRNLLAKRVLAAWGISKLGARINAQFEKLLAESALTQTGKNGDIVFWKNTQHPENYKDFRVMTITGQKRDAEDIPVDEIANGVKEILSHQISLPKEDLVREASKLFGFARSGANVENAMKKGIDKAVVKGFVAEKDGRVVIKDGN